MDNNVPLTDSHPESLQQRLARQVAKDAQPEVLELLQVLRTLEQLHREIREDLFQDALPTDRHNLYKLLKDIEENGGWPYIERLRIQSLVANLPQVAED
jgi:hypothetical protein